MGEHINIKYMFSLFIFSRNFAFDVEKITNEWG